MEIRKTGLYFGDKDKNNKYFIGFRNYDIDGNTCNIFLSDEELINLSKLLSRQVEIIRQRQLEEIVDIPVEEINPFNND